MPADQYSPGSLSKHFCAVCRLSFDSAEISEKHMAGSEHRGQYLKQWYQGNRMLLAQGKLGIDVIPQHLEDGIYDSRSGFITVNMKPGEVKNFSLVIKNCGNSAMVLRLVETLYFSPMISLSDTHGVTKTQRYVRIKPEISYGVDVKCTARDALEVEQVPVTFQFQPDGTEELIFIIRTLVLNVVDSIAADVTPSEAYKRTRPPQPLYRDEYIAGVPLSQQSNPQQPNVNRLKAYRYSNSFHNMALKNFSENKVAKKYSADCAKLKKKLEEGLTRENYGVWYQTMLWMEEMQLETDIRMYSMDEAILTSVPPNVFPYPQCVELKVEGLAEKRPSVLVGDNVYIANCGMRSPVYAGVIHKVLDSSVYLAFHDSFMRSFVSGVRVSVEFEFNRHTLKVCHRALDIGGDLLSKITFPTPQANSSTNNQRRLVPYNRKLENNVEQMQAVKNIVNGTSWPAAYIIFGPPGTGKTVTVVEAIKQVIKEHSGSRVLACAPSNAAADLLAERLLEHLHSTQMMRLSAVSRAVNTIPPHMKCISNIDEGGNIYMPMEPQLSQFRVIVSTMVSASWLVTAGLTMGHMTHIFLDECGHSTEPESLAALAGVANVKTQVVLAGDPYQLGPVIRNTTVMSESKLFKQCGLDKSLLERLMERDLYHSEDGNYNPLVVTKLLNNYRSHKDILNQPNQMFYNSQLKVCADDALVKSLCRWEYLPRKNFPLIFHNVRGKDEREGSSPSYFNSLEVSKVVDYTRKILDTRNPKIRPQDIGIITPYRRQVQKLRNQLKKLKFSDDIKVGSPEEFQGDERRVIIISTVRASADHLAHDQMFKLGFLRNPKRFNVAVTRAKALLIIVGCADIIGSDPYWGNLLQYIEDNGGYVGPAQRNVDIEDVIARFNSLDLKPVLPTEVSAVQLAEAPEFRVDH